MRKYERLKNAQEAFREGRASEALDELEALLKIGESTDDAAGYLLRGLIYEFGGNGISIDLVKAVENYRRASSLIHNSEVTPFLYLARASIKQGIDEYPSALKYVREASSISHTPEVDLAFASYYEHIGDLEAAQTYYKSAALRGRFAGFFGISGLLRRRGKTLEAAIVDFCRILIGPLLFLLLGRAARSSFDGY